MLVFLNGEFVPAAKAVVSVFDRSFLYGDGLFETLRIQSGKIFLWKQHWQRLEQGARFLKISLPYTVAEASRLAGELLAKNNITNGVLRLHLSRGVGVRGYATQGVDRPTFLMSLHDLPPGAADVAPLAGWRLVTASGRLTVADPLAGFKTANRLPYIVARMEAEAAGVEDALLLNTESQVAETTSANLFWIESGRVVTPPVSAGILPGVTRALVLELCTELHLPWLEKNADPEGLRQAEGIFLTMSTWGVVEVKELDGQPLPTSPLPVKIKAALQRRMEAAAGDDALAS